MTSAPGDAAPRDKYPAGRQPDVALAPVTFAPRVICWAQGFLREGAEEREERLTRIIGLRRPRGRKHRPLREERAQTKKKEDIFPRPGVVFLHYYFWSGD